MYVAQRSIERYNYSENR